MPQILTDAACSAPFRGAAIGFHGKIPARGDFVQKGLPRSFTEPWDSWMQQMLTTSRSALGDAWLPAWRAGTVWRFALTPGSCGPDAALGVWTPSVDSVGRYFPLTLAGIVPDTNGPILIRHGGSFLAAMEDAARDAVKKELAPDDLTARITDAPLASPSDPDVDPSLCPDEGGLWWTTAASPGTEIIFTSTRLPDAGTFCAMLNLFA